MINSNHTECDVCHATKGATNHWFVAIQVAPHTGIMFVPAEDATTKRDDPNIQIQDICGQACATKRFSQFLSTLVK